MISQQVVDRLDISSALQAELAQPSSMLPSRTIEHALSDSADEIGSIMTAAARSSFVPQRPEVVAVTKNSRGFRPVHIMDIELRALYRSLVDALAPGVSYPERTDATFEAFKRSPLSDDSKTHVVQADVSSFYQYIDHQILKSELVSQTGDDQIAGELLAILRPVMGRAFGLPQNIGPSHPLADSYIDIVQRRLLRSGHDVSRYNDDFVFAGSGIRDARRALEDFERSLRSLGLTPNEEKTRVHQTEEYEAWVNRPSELKQSISDTLDLDLTAWIAEPLGEYEDDIESEDGSAVDEEKKIDGALRALAEWHGHIETDGFADQLERHIHRGLARDALRVLRRKRSSKGLPFCAALLAFEPQMTHTVCRYLSSISPETDAAPSLIAELVTRSDTHLSIWQKVWMLEPVLAASEVPDAIWAWVGPMLDHRDSSMLRARAALALAAHGQISPSRVGELFDQSTEASKPDLVLAMARVADGNQAIIASVAGENEIFRQVARFAERW